MSRSTRSRRAAPAPQHGSSRRTSTKWRRLGPPPPRKAHGVPQEAANTAFFCVRYCFSLHALSPREVVRAEPSAQPRPDPRSRSTPECCGTTPRRGALRAGAARCWVSRRSGCCCDGGREQLHRPQSSAAKGWSSRSQLVRQLTASLQGNSSFRHGLVEVRGSNCGPSSFAAAIVSARLNASEVELTTAAPRIAGTKRPHSELKHTSSSKAGYISRPVPSYGDALHFLRNLSRQNNASVHVMNERVMMQPISL